MDGSIDLLMELGFNRLEADVYLYLLANEPTTAYKIGKSINKPTANIYKAIESLAVKGAVMVEDNRSKVCRAVDHNEFLILYEKRVEEITSNARKLLSSIEQDNSEVKSYTIESPNLVFARFEAMMKKCKTIAVVDAFPKSLECVVGYIEEATARGVEVYVEAYQQVKIRGADIAYAPVGQKALEHWKSQQLNLIIDGEEYLIALLDDSLKKVKQATWSNNTYMACMLHAGIMREQTLMKVMDAASKPNFEAKAKNILEKQKFFFNSNIPGFDKLKNIM